MKHNYNQVYLFATCAIRYSKRERKSFLILLVAAWFSGKCSRPHCRMTFGRFIRRQGLNMWSRKLPSKPKRAIKNRFKSGTTVSRFKLTLVTRPTVSSSTRNTSVPHPRCRLWWKISAVSTAYPESRPHLAVSAGATRASTIRHCVPHHSGMYLVEFLSPCFLSDLVT